MAEHYISSFNANILLCINYWIITMISSPYFFFIQAYLLYIQLPGSKGSDQNNFGSVCHFLAVDFRDKDTGQMSHWKDGIKQRGPSQINPLFCVNTPSEAWLQEKYSAREDMRGEKTQFYWPKTCSFEASVPPAHCVSCSGSQVPRPIRSRLMGGGGVSLWTSCPAITGAAQEDKQPLTGLGIQPTWHNSSSSSAATDFRINTKFTMK